MDTGHVLRKRRLLHIVTHRQKNKEGLNLDFVFVLYRVLNRNWPKKKPQILPKILPNASLLPPPYPPYPPYRLAAASLSPRCRLPIASLSPPTQKVATTQVVTTTTHLMPPKLAQSHTAAAPPPPHRALNRNWPNLVPHRLAAPASLSPRCRLPIASPSPRCRLPIASLSPRCDLPVASLSPPCRLAAKKYLEKST